MIQEIPLTSVDPIFRITTPLDGGTYVLDITWHDRPGYWYLDLYVQSDTDPVPVLLGQKLVRGAPLLQGVVADGRPVGELLITDPSGGDDPGRYDLGTRCRLVYLDAEELGRD